MIIAFFSTTDFYLTNSIHRSNETYKNYAKFEGLNTSVGYLFTVYSTNKEGFSTDYSTVYVPSEADSKLLIFFLKTY